MKYLRIKDIMNVNRGASPRPISNQEYFSEKGMYGWVRISDVTRSNKYLTDVNEYLSDLGSFFSVKLDKETLFLSIAGSVGKACINKIPVCIHDGFVYFSGIKNYDIDYLFWFFSNSRIYEGLGKKGVFLNLNIDAIKNIMIPKLTKNEQLKISNFLNENCSKIDSEISLLEKKSKLLEEYKQSLIFETVTKGLDKNAKMKDSGVEWIGEMPEHWTIKRVKEIAKWKNGFTPSSTNEDFYNGVDKWVTIADMQGRYIIDSKKTIDGKLFSNKIKVPSDSLLFSFKLSIGQVAFNREPLFTNEAICSFLPTSKINLNYLYYAAPIFLVKNAKKNIYNADLLNQELISNSICLFPTKEDQSKISVFLDKRTNEIEENINLINKKIELLKEYKQSLIHEAVTGQLEI